MSRFSSIVSSWLRIPTISRHQVALDLGSYYLRVVVDDDVVINQPNCFLYDPAAQAVISVGQRAYQLLGKAPGQTKVIFPFEHGVVAQEKRTRLYLEAILAQVKESGGFSLFSSLATICSVASVATDLDRKILVKVLRQAGWGQVRLSSLSQSLWKALSYQLSHDQQAFVANNKSRIPKKNNGQQPVQHQVGQVKFKFQPATHSIPAQDLVVLDLGHYLTEISIISQEKANYSHTIKFGGHNFTLAIQNVLKQQFQIQISYQQAEILKRQLPDLITVSGHETKTNVRGVDTAQHLITTKTIGTNKLAEAVQTQVGQLFHYLQRTFSLVEPERLLAAFDNGVYITGGASLLAGVKPYLSRQLEVNVIAANDPYLDVVKGLVLMGKDS